MYSRKRDRGNVDLPYWYEQPFYGGKPESVTTGRNHVHDVSYGRGNS